MTDKQASKQRQTPSQWLRRYRLHADRFVQDGGVQDSVT